MQHLCSDLSTSFHQATSRSVLRCRASRTDGGTDSAAEVLKTGTKFGYAHDLLELGEDDQRSWGWENSHVIIGLLWFTMVYFMLFHFFWRFYGFRDFWRCPMILNGGIWRYMIGKYEITRRVFFFHLWLLGQILFESIEVLQLQKMVWWQCSIVISLWISLYSEVLTWTHVEICTVTRSNIIYQRWEGPLLLLGLPLDNGYIYRHVTYIIYI
jgi:hypothetical protein